MTAKKINSRKVQAEATRNKIYDTSVKMLEQKGYKNLKIDDICKKAGVSVGSFYNYFKSKNDILIEIYKRGDAYFEDVVRPNVFGKNAVENIVDFFVYYAKLNEITGVEIIKQLFSSDNKLYITRGRKIQMVLIDVIKKGQESGELRTDIEPEKITEYLFISARGVCYDWATHDGNYDLQEFIKKYMKPIIEIYSTMKISG